MQGFLYNLKYIYTQSMYMHIYLINHLHFTKDGSMDQSVVLSTCCTEKTGVST